ncbi:MAG: acetyl ornithine aminotransferase family protein [Nanoarchaeota archaeon]
MKPHIKILPPGPKARAIIARDNAVTSQSLGRPYDLVVAKTYGVNIEDPDGNRFLDFNSGVAVANTGYNHPAIIKAIRKQLGATLHGAFLDFYGEVPLRYQEKLVRLMPHGIDTVFLSNSGTEAVEAARKLAIYYTRRAYIMGFYGAFHGRTMGSLSITCSKTVYRNRFGPFLPTIHVPYPNLYRNPFGTSNPAQVAKASLDFIEDTIFHKQVDPKEIAAIMFEPIQGEGGYIVPPIAFVKGIRRLCNAYDILLIADEIQTGCMRTGRFLAIEHFGVTPDIICLAKAAGGGLPLAATLYKKKYDTWPRASHASTFGGNHLSAAAGLEALNLLSKPSLGLEVTKKGNYIQSYLRDLALSEHIIGDIRGIGLMIGIELVKNRHSKIPASIERDHILKTCFKSGLALLGAGTSTIRIAPPLIIDYSDIDAGLDILCRAIKQEHKGMLS